MPLFESLPLGAATLAQVTVAEADPDARIALVAKAALTSATIPRPWTATRRVLRSLDTKPKYARHCTYANRLAI